jgi:23S rRNA (adenine2503-C2)-methyltransferase
VKHCICSVTLEELQQYLKDAGFKKFRAAQVLNWVYSNFITDPDKMINIPLKLRQFLQENFTADNMDAAEILQSSDGTEKVLINLKRTGDAIESVIIPTARRITFCLSTQVGCPVGCRFCASGKNGLKRNLSAGEIVAQLILCSSIAGRKPDNIVFMGIGEPMLNINNLIKALYFISDNDYFGMAQRHITVSTSGIVKGIYKLADTERQYNLAVSLHGPTDDLRARLIPGRFRDSITDIIDACRAYRKKTTRMVTFEYTLIKGVNDSPRQAEQLAELALRTYAKVNLIPYNSVSDAEFQPPEKSTVSAFLNILLQNDVQATVRQKRGDDSNAACGQLRNRSLEIS